MIDIKDYVFEFSVEDDLEDYMGLYNSFKMVKEWFLKCVFEYFVCSGGIDVNFWFLWLLCFGDDYCICFYILKDYLVILSYMIFSYCWGDV